MAKRQTGKRWKAKKAGFRSGFEQEVSNNLKLRQVDFDYEALKLKYEVPARTATYTPDFILHNGIIVESKGRFLAADRKKMLLVKLHNPTLDIRLLFQNAKNKIAKNSKTTYADWCVKNNFKYAEGTIPDSWIR